MARITRATISRILPLISSSSLRSRMSAIRTQTQTKHVFRIPSQNSPPNGAPLTISPYSSADAEKLPAEPKSTRETKTEFHAQIVWFNAIGFLLMHLAAVYGFALQFTSAKLLTTMWSWGFGYTAALGVTMGAHRLYAHKTFEANKYLRFVLLMFQTISGQNCLWVWVRDHRQHHKFSDTDADPHNSKRGFFFSHIGWLMVRKHPEVINKGKTIDMSDLDQDPLIMFQKRHYKKLFFVLGLIFPVAVPYLLWDEYLSTSFFLCFMTRMGISLNFVWLVNSAAHIYGTRPFTKDMPPAENSLVSFIALGEGWHNYHHTFPWDYRAAEFGQYFNLTTSVIDYCARRGWVYNVKSADSKLVIRQAVKKGDGTHHTYGGLDPTAIEDY